MIGKLVRFLGSVRFTLFLILSLAVMFLLGLWIPQKSVLQRDLYLQWQAKAPEIVALLDRLQLTSIYTSPITLTLWSLFFLHLVFVMGQRIPMVKKKIKLREKICEDVVVSHVFPQKAVVPLAKTDDIEQITSLLQRAGYRVAVTADWLFAVKNRFSPLATLFFHFSFLLILLGGVISVYTRFSGTLDLAEGEAFRGELVQYNPYPKLPKIGSPPNADFIIEAIRPSVERGTHTGITVTLVDSHGTRHKAEVNRPYTIDNTSFVIRTLGIAPLIILRDERGNDLDGAYVKLNVLQGKADTFDMEQLHFDVSFFPEKNSRYDIDGNVAEATSNPVFLLVVRKGNQALGRYNVRINETVPIDGYRLEIKEIPFWIRFYVVKERGLPILYTGFAIATIALIWRLIYYRRDIVGVVKRREGKDMLLLSGRGEFYPVLFGDEFKRLTTSIRSLMGGA